MSESLQNPTPSQANARSILHDSYAADYDRQVREYGSYLAEALFGVSYEFIQPGERLLDIGIGTGLSAALFAKAGLQVHGMDFSPAMLEICQEKRVAIDLKLQDVQQFPWPYPDGFFNHLVCCGVLHFIPELNGILGEARRVLRTGGSFALTTKVPSAGGEREFEHTRIGKFDVYAHHLTYIQDLLRENSFDQLKMLVCQVGQDAFGAWVVQKNRV